MIITRICISSSLGSLKTDLTEITYFFKRLNNCFVKRGLYFALETNEDALDDGNSYPEQSGQLMIAGSNERSIAFFLLSKDSDDILKQLYKAARDSFSKTGDPKIVIYVKGIGEEINVESLLREKLSADSGELYNTYNHIDTLKLGILMQIRQLELPGVDIQLNEGKAWQGSDALLTLDNVETVSGFENLQTLKHNREALETRFYSARTRYAENPENEAAYKEFLEASRMRNDAIQEIRRIETQLYHMIEGMYEQTADGKLSRRLSESHKLIERGLLNEARDVLDFYAIINESRHDEEIVEQAAKRAQIHIQELMRLKDVDTTLLDWDGAEECYKEAVRLEDKHDLLRTASFLYVDFLNDQTRSSEAISVGEKLLYRYQNSPDDMIKVKLIELLRLLGICYQDLGNRKEAERKYVEALTMIGTLSLGNQHTMEIYVARINCRLGGMYILSQRYEEAITTLIEGLELLRKRTDIDVHLFELADVYANLGWLYRKKQEYDKSLEMFESAQEFFREANEKSPDNKCANRQGFCLESLGLIYMSLGDFEEAEHKLDSAHEAYKQAVNSNPDAFGYSLVTVNANYGELYAAKKRYKEAEDAVRTALKMIAMRERSNLYFGHQSVILLHFFLCNIYIKTERFIEAEVEINSALKSNDKYKDFIPEYEDNLIEAQMLKENLKNAQLPAESGLMNLSATEKEVALLLTEGLSQREISRKLGVTAAEVTRRVNAVRDKVSGNITSDPVIEVVGREYNLTRRETDMLRRLQQNKSTEVIANELYLSNDTVRVHVRNLLKKLSIESRTDVTVWLESYASNMK